MNITNLWNQAPRKEPNQTGSWKNTFWDKLQRPRIHRGRGNQKNQGSSSSLTFSNPFFFFFFTFFFSNTPHSYVLQEPSFKLSSPKYIFFYQGKHKEIVRRNREKERRGDSQDSATLKKIIIIIQSKGKRSNMYCYCFFRVSLGG